MDDVESVDGKKQDLKIAQSANNDSPTVPLQHAFELTVECKVDVETFSMPASPHDRDVMPKAQGVMKRDPLVQQSQPIVQL